MAFVVRETQTTPNPNAIKFVLDREITTERLSFANPAAAAEHALAAQLFALDGVAGLLLMGDFVTVLKKPSAKWALLKPSVKKILSAEFSD